MIDLTTNQLAPEPSPEDTLMLLARLQAQLEKRGSPVRVVRLQLVAGVWWAHAEDGKCHRVSDLLDRAGRDL